MKTIQLAMAEETGNIKIDELRIFITGGPARNETYKEQANILVTALEQSLPQGTMEEIRERIKK